MDEQSTSPRKKPTKRSVGQKGRRKREEFSQPPPLAPVPDYVGEAAREELAKGVYKPPVTEPAFIDYQLIQEKIALQEQKNKMIYGLPHLYGWKWYPWAREFYESRAKLNFLCAANQISKSSTQIRKAIHWATAKDLWPQLWERQPSQFWYLYPSQDVVDIEFELKWEREFLPRGEFKDDPVYGWKKIVDRGKVKGIRFNSGVYLFFKTYAQDVQNLQTGTCDAIFCDEELPEDLYSELTNRTNATSGYFHMVFTATLGQDIWRRTMEPDEREEEQFPDAAKWTISLYEAKFYEDGTPSHWTDEKIAGVVSKCKSQQEVLKRVYGRFIILTGRKYPTFDATIHIKPHHHIPINWLIYSGADPGTGGENNHPAALCYVAVAPDYRSGRVFLGWRGDKIETTNDDVVKKHIELKKDNKISPIGQYYDHSNKDFEITARRMQETFFKADKSHEVGEGILNTLFKNKMLYIYDVDELAKLAQELSTLREGQNKRHAKDDFIDALRYAVSSVPWDFSGIVGLPTDYVENVEPNLTPMQRELAERRAAFENEEEQATIDQEFAEANEFYGS